jgi:hypothetical protein
MTAELQKLWIAQPIAFVGQIVDVESIGSGRDRVTINAESMMNGYQFIEDLRLSLVAPEAKMDAFIAANPESAHGNGLTNAVAVIARVSGITSQPVPDSEGAIDLVKTGDGELLEILYLGQAALLGHR